jgi:DNA replication protein DnaC
METETTQLPQHQNTPVLMMDFKDKCKMCGAETSMSNTFNLEGCCSHECKEKFFDVRKKCIICDVEFNYTDVYNNSKENYDIKGLYLKGLCSQSCKYKYEINIQLGLRKKYQSEWLDKMFVAPLFLNCSFDNYNTNKKNEKTILNIKQCAVKEFDKFIFIYGNPGTGKTHLSVSYLRERMFTDTRRMKFISVPKLLLEIRGAFNKDSEVTEQKIVDDYCKIPILVLDDLGTEKSSDFVLQCVYLILDSRYSSLLPTIITSNLNLEQISSIYGDRISSRIASGKIFLIDSDDYRITKKQSKDIPEGPLNIGVSKMGPIWDGKQPLMKDKNVWKIQ